MTQSGTYQHQGTLSVGKGTDRLCPAFNLTIKPFNGVVGPDSASVPGRKISIGKGFLHTGADAVLGLLFGVYSVFVTIPQLF